MHLSDITKRIDTANGNVLLQVHLQTKQQLSIIISSLGVCVNSLMQLKLCISGLINHLFFNWVHQPVLQNENPKYCVLSFLFCLFEKMRALNVMFWTKNYQN